LRLDKDIALVSRLHPHERRRYCTAVTPRYVFVRALSVPCLTLPIGRRNDTKFVAIGVCHNNVIGMGSRLTRETCGTENIKQGDCLAFIIRIESEMQAVPPNLRCL